MTGKLFIDGVDAYTSFGVFVTSGGYNELVSFPPLKSVALNDWPETDGVEPDLLNPVLDMKEFRMSFNMLSENGFGAFLALLSNGAHHVFNFAEIGRSYKLRLVSMSSLKVHFDIRVFSLQMANDFPVSDSYSYSPPASNVFIGSTGYTLDGIDMAQYGINILQGTKAEILKQPPAKKNLLRKFNNVGGVQYDGGVVIYQSKDVALNCLMRAKTLTGLWRNYDALIYNLVRPNERKLGVSYTGGEYPCFYKGCKTVRFYPVDKIWWEFTLTLVFTKFRV